VYGGDILWPNSDGATRYLVLCQLEARHPAMARAFWQENRACDKKPRMIEVDGGEKDDDVRVVGETLSLERNA
jgi:hypothetical protein